MKRKYFFGIFICLVLLCSGVFLLSFDEKVTAIPPTHAPEISDAENRTYNFKFNTYGRSNFGCELEYRLSVSYTFITTQYKLYYGTIFEGAGTTFTTDIECKTLGNIKGAEFLITSITVEPGNAICATLYNGGVFNWTDEQAVSSSNNTTIDIYYNESIPIYESILLLDSPIGSLCFNYYNYQITELKVSSGRSGYTFDGCTFWEVGSLKQTKIVNADGTSALSTLPAGNPPYRDFNAVKSDGTRIGYLIADWKPISYKIAYNLNGGTHGSSHPNSADYNERIHISNPTRPGYSFKGWTISNYSSGATYYSSNYSISGTTYRGALTKNEYFRYLNTTQGATVTFNANWERNNYKIDINFYKPGGSTQNGGTFDLYKQLSGGTKTLITEGLTNEPEKDYYLQYEGQWILENIEPNPGTYISSVSLKDRGEMSVEGDLPNVTRITYTANQTGPPSGDWDGTVRIYTEKNSLKATLNYQGKGTGSTIATAGYNENGTTLNLPSPTHKGYTFKGWNTASDGSGKYYTSKTNFNVINNDLDDETGVLSSHCVATPNAKEISFNLYAIWEANDYTVTLNDGEGAVSNLANMPWIASATVSGGRYSYTSGNLNLEYNNSTRNIKLNGTPASGFILYRSTGLTFSEGDQYRIEITHKGGNMLSWSGNGYFVLEVCDENGNNFSSNRQYVDMLNINGLAIDSTTSYTLTINANSANLGKGLKVWYYAAGTPSSQMITNYEAYFKITKLGSEQNVDQEVTATYDSPMSLVAVPTKFGHTFNGYFDMASGGKQYYNADGTSAREWDKANAATLYAQWTPYSYTLTLNGNGGTTKTGQQTITQSGSYASTLTLDSKPFIRNGYIFEGWSTAKNGAVIYSDEANYSSLITSNPTSITLYAQWEDTWANHASSSLKTTEINGVTYNVIASAKDLAYLSKQSISSTLLGKYIQTADIDLSDYTWLPIGSEHAFCGEYLGRGHKITGLHTSDAVDANGVYLQTYGGLFGKLGENSTTDASANIVGVYITDCLVYGQYSGAIAGFSDVDSVNIEACIEACILENVKIYGNTTASFVGSSSDGQIKDCLLISSNISTANATTRGFYTGTMTVNSSYYMNGTTPTQFYTSGASNDYSNWVTGVFKYPLPKALIWYPGA